MSDVPVTAWWLVATLLVATPTAASALRRRARCVGCDCDEAEPRSAGSGARGLRALLLRQLVLRTRLRNASAFAAGVVPGCVGLALLNRSLYGSPFESGYGSTAELFKLEYLSCESVQLSAMAHRDGNAVDSSRVRCAVAHPHVPVLVVRCNHQRRSLSLTRFIFRSITGPTFAFCCRRYALLLILSGAVILHLLAAPAVALRTMGWWPPCVSR